MALSYTGPNARVCRVCGCEKSTVINSRSHVEKDILERRRECTNCGRRWSTVEISVFDYEKYVAPNYPKPKGKAGLYGTEDEDFD